MLPWRTGYKLHKPLIWGEPEPVPNALPRGHAMDFEHGIGLPLHHGNVSALVVLPDRARRGGRLRYDTVRDARLRAKNRAIQDGAVELRKLERDAVRLH